MVHAPGPAKFNLVPNLLFEVFINLSKNLGKCLQCACNSNFGGPAGGSAPGKVHTLFELCISCGL